jgi:hypothetical protein
MIPDEKLLRAFGPDHRVLVWLGEGALSTATAGFTTIDYLLDGLVRGHVAAQEQTTGHVVFTHQGFGRTCWVVYADATTGPAKTLEALSALLPAEARFHVVVYGGTPADSWTKSLSRVFQETLVVPI